MTLSLARQCKWGSFRQWAAGSGEGWGVTVGSSAGQASGMNGHSSADPELDGCETSDLAFTRALQHPASGQFDAPDDEKFELLSPASSTIPPEVYTWPFVNQVWPLPIPGQTSALIVQLIDQWLSVPFQ